MPTVDETPGPSVLVILEIPVIGLSYSTYQSRSKRRL